MSTQKPSYLNFDKKDYPWKPDIDYRASPWHYRVGNGEQGVLICEPYKSEIGQHWRFKTEAIAEESSAKIFAMFEDYLKANDFVGADMARKYLQMGYTRAGAMRTTREGIRTIKTRIMRYWNAAPVIWKRPLLQTCFIDDGSRPRLMRHMT